jgi:hypothetical protein
MAKRARGDIDLARLASPGGLAAQIPLRMGLRAPLQTLGLTPREQGKWAETFHGGWTSANPLVLGRPVPVVSIDISSCYPLVAHQIGWWDLFSAERIQRRGVTRLLRNVCQRAIEDPTTVLDPAVWRSLGCTLVEIIPDGEVWPFELEDEHRADGRLEFVPGWSPCRPFHFAWPDVVHAAIEARRVPRIIRATRLAPIGRQTVIREQLPVLPGLVLLADEDPVLRLVAYRRRMKDEGNVRMARLLHAVVNSLVSGNFSRFDEVRVKRHGEWLTSEKPGPWNCMPIASTVTAGSHLLLGIYDRMVTDLGSIVLYRDTDSSMVPSLPDGGSVVLPDGTQLPLLAWDQVDRIADAFAPLSPSPDWPLWKVDPGTADDPLHALVHGPKRRIEFSKEGLQ